MSPTLSARSVPGASSRSIHLRAWNLKDRAGALVPDGTYTVRMESTDLNANTAAQNNQGTFTFVKGPAPQNQTGLTNGGFTDVSIVFMP